MAITLVCPSCGEECDHLVLDGSRNPVVQCTLCGHTHRKAAEKEEEEIMVKAIVSCEDTSLVGSVPLSPGETVAVGDLLAAESGDEVTGVEVTAIEIGPRRVKRAKAQDITCLWTRAIEQVVVRASVHRGRVTKPVAVACDGDQEFAVGSSCTFGTLSFRISHMKLRDGKVLRKEGQKAPARSVKRIYGYRA